MIISISINHKAAYGRNQKCTRATEHTEDTESKSKKVKVKSVESQGNDFL